MIVEKATRQRFRTYPYSYLRQAGCNCKVTFCDEKGWNLSPVYGLTRTSEADWPAGCARTAAAMVWAREDVTCSRTLPGPWAVSIRRFCCRKCFQNGRYNVALLLAVSHVVFFDMMDTMRLHLSDSHQANVMEILLCLQEASGGPLVAQINQVKALRWPPVFLFLIYTGAYF